MNIYKLSFKNSSEKVVTAEDTESAEKRYDSDSIADIENYGPYLGDSVYKEIRKELKN